MLFVMVPMQLVHVESASTDNVYHQNIGDSLHSLSHAAWHTVHEAHW